MILIDCWRLSQTKSGAYRSTLITKIFATSHVHIIFKTDVTYGKPSGAMSVCATAVSLEYCKMLVELTYFAG